MDGEKLIAGMGRDRVIPGLLDHAHGFCDLLVVGAGN